MKCTHHVQGNFREEIIQVLSANCSLQQIKEQAYKLTGRIHGNPLTTIIYFTHPSYTKIGAVTK